MLNPTECYFYNRLREAFSGPERKECNMFNCARCGHLVGVGPGLNISCVCHAPSPLVLGERHFEHPETLRVLSWDEAAKIIDSGGYVLIMKDTYADALEQRGDLQ